MLMLLYLAGGPEASSASHAVSVFQTAAEQLHHASGCRHAVRQSVDTVRTRNKTVMISAVLDGSQVTIEGCTFEYLRTCECCCQAASRLRLSVYNLSAASGHIGCTSL
jgi:hypothetical protein